jgi:hypothetical protein
MPTACASAQPFWGVATDGASQHVPCRVVPPTEHRAAIGAGEGMTLAGNLRIWADR